MGLHTNTIEEPRRRFHFTERSPETVATQLDDRFFTIPLDSEGLHTLPFLPNDYFLFGIARDTSEIRQLSELFPTEGTYAVELERNLRQAEIYADVARHRLEYLRPTSWWEFTTQLTAPLILRSADLVSKMKRQLSNRKPCVSSPERVAEYEALHDCIDRKLLRDIGESASLYVKVPKQREYAEGAIYAALVRIYTGETIAKMQVEKLRECSAAVLLQYAFVLSLVERQNIFSSYSRDIMGQNLVPTQWVFD